MASAGQHEKSVARQAGGAFRRHTPGGAGRICAGRLRRRAHGKHSGSGRCDQGAHLFLLQK